MTDEKKIVQDADLRDAIRFHGHMCPGLAIGYGAAKIAMERLGSRRAEDEELIAIVENDSCSVDAVQWLTGCTFGKGNFIFRDYGKQVFTFAMRPTGRAIRIALRPEFMRREAAEQDREAKIEHILNAPAEDIFTITEMTIELPPPAQIHESVICDICGEGVMSTRTKTIAGRTMCIPCSEAQDR